MYKAILNLYRRNKITKEKVQSYVVRGLITAEEYKGITGEEYTG